MCDNLEKISKTAVRRFEERLLIESQTGRNELKVDDRYAYFGGKAIPLSLWRSQALQIGLEAHLYLEVVARARDYPGAQIVQFRDQNFLVETGGTVTQGRVPHRKVRSVMPYES